MTTNGTATFTASEARSYRLSKVSNHRLGMIWVSAPKISMANTRGVAVVLKIASPDTSVPR